MSGMDPVLDYILDIDTADINSEEEPEIEDTVPATDTEIESEAEVTSQEASAKSKRVAETVENDF